jgi:hypothetical protein
MLCNGILQLKHRVLLKLFVVSGLLMLIAFSFTRILDNSHDVNEIYRSNMTSMERAKQQQQFIDRLTQNIVSAHRKNNIIYSEDQPSYWASKLLLNLENILQELKQNAQLQITEHDNFDDIKMLLGDMAPKLYYSLELCFYMPTIEEARRVIKRLEKLVPGNARILNLEMQNLDILTPRIIHNLETTQKMALVQTKILILFQKNYDE